MQLPVVSARLYRASVSGKEHFSDGMYSYIGRTLDNAATITNRAVIIFTYRVRRYHSAMIITVLFVFFGLFAFLFFASGGYHGGMPSCFIFEAVFTAFMPDGFVMSG